MSHIFVAKETRPAGVTLGEALMAVTKPSPLPKNMSGLAFLVPLQKIHEWSVEEKKEDMEVMRKLIAGLVYIAEGKEGAMEIVEVTESDGTLQTKQTESLKNAAHADIDLDDNTSPRVRFSLKDDEEFPIEAECTLIKELLKEVARVAAISVDARDLADTAHCLVTGSVGKADEDFDKASIFAREALKKSDEALLLTEEVTFLADEALDAEADFVVLTEPVERVTRLLRKVEGIADEARMLATEAMALLSTTTITAAAADSPDDANTTLNAPIRTNENSTHNASNNVSPVAKVEVALDKVEDTSNLQQMAAFSMEDKMLFLQNSVTALHEKTELCIKESNVRAEMFRVEAELARKESLARADITDTIIGELKTIIRQAAEKLEDAEKRAEVAANRVVAVEREIDALWAEQLNLRTRMENYVASNWTGRIFRK